MALNKIEEYFIEEFTTLIEIRKDQLLGKLKLNLALYDNVEDKNKITFSLLEETRNKLSKYEGDFADFIRCGIQEKKLFHLGDDNLRILSLNFIFENSPEDFWDESNFIDDVDFEVIYESHPSKKLFKKFIEAFALVGLFEYLVWMKDYHEKEGFNPDLLTKSTKQSVYLKFNGGRRLNLQERYYLINEFLNIDKRLLVIESKEKREELLAFILHCNPKNAQQVLNGTYDAKFRSSEISEYIKTIEKE